MGMNSNYIYGLKSARATELTHGRPTRTYGRGRVCSASGCRANLSVYNPHHRCAIHDHLL
jgi:hypothetical protein